MSNSYREEPAIKRAIAFIDGQNLYHGAKEAFGYSYPNYNVAKLSEHICANMAWNLTGVRFYTGVPDASDDAFWNRFWVAKLGTMGREGVNVFSRSLRYRNKTVSIAGGVNYTFLSGEEKGIDVRIALDVIRLAIGAQYDVGIIFSQDQDLSEAADEVRSIARSQNRWIKVACAYPTSPTSKNTRGINHTDWIKIDRKIYDSCIDQRDYRNPPAQPTPPSV